MVAVQLPVGECVRRKPTLAGVICQGGQRDTSAVVSVLEREVFSEAEAARLLRVAQSTLHYWLESGERRGKSYKPVLRTEPRCPLRDLG